MLSLNVAESRKIISLKAKGWKFERKLGKWEGFKDESQTEIGKRAVRRQIEASRRSALGNCRGLCRRTRASALVCASASACIYLVERPKSRSWLQLDLTVLSSSSRCTQDGDGHAL